MITKLQTNDKDIRSVRINIDINCGYLEISESRRELMDNGHHMK